MAEASSDVWEVMSTARTIRRSTSEPVDELWLFGYLTSWASYGGEALLREAVGAPEDWMLAGRVVVGWPQGTHGLVRRRPLSAAVTLDHWDQPLTS